MEIERNPSCPKLNNKAIKLITELVFRKDDLVKKAEGIFVFSTTICLEREVELIEKLLAKKVSDKVFVTGGVLANKVAKDLRVNFAGKEADLFLQALDTKKFPSVKFFVERRSTNTLENVTETLKDGEFKKCKSILFIFKSHAAGRGYLTLRKFLPKAQIYQKTFNTKYVSAKKEITRNNWHTFEFGRERVWGEFLRIEKYGSRGDIEYASVKELVAKIKYALKSAAK